MSDLTNTFGGITPLMTAALEGDTDMARTLIQAGANVDARDGWGHSALMLALEEGHTDIAQLLIQAGASHFFMGLGDKTALHWAAFGSAEVVLDLIQAGADVNVYDSEGETPLMYAAQVGNTDVVRLLIQAGANVNDENDNEMTALMIAEDLGFTDTVQAINNYIRSLLASQAINTVIPRHRARQRDRMALGELELSWGRVPDGRLPSIPLEEGPPLRRRRLSSRGPGFNDLVYAYIQDFL